MHVAARVFQYAVHSDKITTLEQKCINDIIITVYLK